ncbi:MAG: CPBP family intramembrane metalloprotease [Bacteroidetes bacterium]|nr:MAG: CPBP family intramembrane metalloprotease [Bacteroidota bacterium]
MLRYLLEPVLHIALLAPFFFLWKEKAGREALQTLGVLASSYVIYKLLVRLPYLWPVLDVLPGAWNWEGKLLGVLWVLVVYGLFRHRFRADDFFTLRQDPQHFRSALAAAVGVVVLATVLWYFLGGEAFDLETLAFQLTLPGLDEEGMFRGVFLGLLLGTLRERVRGVGNPAVLLSALLFGLMHALQVRKDYSLSWDSFYFLQTAFGGWVWGWVAWKSRSLLLPVLSHNFSNFFGTLASMLK